MRHTNGWVASGQEWSQNDEEGTLTYCLQRQGHNHTDNRHVNFEFINVVTCVQHGTSARHSSWVTGVSEFETVSTKNHNMSDLVQAHSKHQVWTIQVPDSTPLARPPTAKHHQPQQRQATGAWSTFGPRSCTGVCPSAPAVSTREIVEVIPHERILECIEEEFIDDPSSANDGANDRGREVRLTRPGVEYSNLFLACPVAAFFLSSYCFTA